jgi:putative ABC transport system ATP-binding protein
MFSIVGPWGSGKSTLLGNMGGLDNPTPGIVLLNGQNISHMNEQRGVEQPQMQNGLRGQRA